MTHSNTDNNPPPQEFYVRGDFPFVFMPATSSATGYTFVNDHTQVFNDDNHVTTEVIDEEERRRDTTVHNQDDNNEENDDDNEERNDIRISQPKYSQLLKDLDFSETRLYDVTKLLSDETNYYTTVDDNESQKKNSTDGSNQSLSPNHSSESSNESVNHRSSSTTNNNIHKMKEKENLTIGDNDLNHLSETIQEVSSVSTEDYDNHRDNDTDINVDMRQKLFVEEHGDNTKRSAQNYNPNNNVQENTSYKPNKNSRFPTQNSTNIDNDNLSSIPRLSTNASTRTDNQEQSQEYEFNWNDLINGTDGFMQSPTVVIIAQSIDDLHTTPTKQQQQQQQQQQQTTTSPNEKLKQHINISPKQKVHQRLRQLSASSDTDSIAEYVVNRTKQKQHSSSQPHLSIDEEYNDLNTHLKPNLNDQERPYTSASDILLGRSSNQNIDQTNSTKKKPHHHQRSSLSSRHINQEDNNQSINNDTWLSMLEKLEREHKERLEKQQKQYEAYMHELEEKMKRRFEEYLSSTNSLHESKPESMETSAHLRRSHDSTLNESYDGKYKNSSTSHHCRTFVPDSSHHHYYSTNSINNFHTSERRPSIRTNLSRSQSREDISNLRTELSVKHAKHISDLKLYYEHEIEELKNQLNTTKMGHTASSTRQSLETIERLNNDNMRLHDEMKELRRSLKLSTDENDMFKRQIEELRDQLKSKDFEFKNHQRVINDLQQQLNDLRSIKERQDEKLRHTDKQTLQYRQDNEQIASDLNLTRERLVRLEERYRDLDNETKAYRQANFTNDTNNQRNNDNLKYNITMPVHMPTSREYGRFTTTTSRYSSSTVTSPRSSNLDSARYGSNDSEDLFRRTNSPRPLLTINDYLNDKPKFPPAYVPPSRPLYSPKKSPPTRRSMNQIPVRDLIDNQIKQSEHLEEKFDELLTKKRDLESRINRIPARGLTNNDRQLLDVLEREIERVEQQISSVKLELRKLNII
ncbi:unnamed protein product [Adineta steineri]|uniref:Uncharacterized protein n=1 Tax=Adineta steineri TaxID=433720 RepID=A0A815G5I1_9BILA|nr:unnamed protein product [Adineta steineri]CAF1334106.1 unnamed protein product [Adineta steineri]